MILEIRYQAVRNKPESLDSLKDAPEPHSLCSLGQVIQVVNLQCSTCCLAGSKIEGRKMIDFASKAAIKILVQQEPH